jgi:hypothetical protein
MTRALHDTDPHGSPPPGANAGGDARPRAEEGTEAEPRLPLRAPTEDERMRSLLDGLNASRAPAPIDAATTDGDLAAKYSAGPGAPPARHQTPAPQPSVVFSETMRLASLPAVVETAARERATGEARKAVTVRIDRRAAERALGESVRGEAPASALEEAHRAGQRRGLIIGVPIGTAAGAVAAFLLTFSLMAARAAHSRVSSTTQGSAPQAATAPAPPPQATETSPPPAEGSPPAASEPAPDSVAAAPSAAPSAADLRAPVVRAGVGKRRGAPALSAAPSAPSASTAPKTRGDKNTMVNDL